MNTKTRSVIIVAGGSGTRMGTELPKQFLALNGEPILLHTIRKFLSFDNEIEIVVVLPEIHEELFFSVIGNHFDKDRILIAFGGNTRFDSVKNGLELVSGDLIAVHDAVRPLVSLDTIRRCFEMASKEGTAIPVVSAIDSLRIVSGNDSTVLDRERVMIVQTPQTFRSELLINAYKALNNIGFTDDASVVEASGYTVQLVEGNRENIKITTPFDLQLANNFLNSNR